MTVIVSQPTSGTSQSGNVSTPLTNSVIWSSSPGPALSPWPFQNSNTSTPLTTSVIWSKPSGPALSEDLGREIRHSGASLAGVTSFTPTSTSSHSYPCGSKSASPLKYFQSGPATQWRPGTRSTSTPYITGFNVTSRHYSAQAVPVEEPVDVFIDRLTEGQETVFQISFTSSQTDSSIALLRAREQQRLPPLELFKLTGKPIDWPKFIERFRNQIHNKTTLTDSDQMAYVFQNLDGEAKKAVESLDVAGHSSSAALKTLKCLFGNPESVASAYLKNMLESPYVTSNDRQALRVYYYQVKACAT